MPEPNNQQPEEFDYRNQDEDTKSRKARANKFYSLSAQIESSTKTFKALLGGKKERYGAHTYVILTEEQNTIFLDALGEINKLIAEAQTMLDSYIELDRSTPKFENYLNLFYNMYEKNITEHSETIFFMVHARDEQLYLYPYFGLTAGHFGFGKLSILLARVRGTLTKCGDYTLDEPSNAPAPASQSDRYGAGYSGQYPRQYSSSDNKGRGDWRGDWDKERTERREPRDIGDVQEQRI